MIEQPLVSIVVITYNSSDYVLETLESAKDQTYKNIELIISDDCSNDNTVEICKNWLEENKERFKHTELITVKKNTGIAPNLNRGIKQSNGIWIKSIAGDDALEDNIIEKYLEYSYLNKEAFILYSNVTIYQNEFKEENILPFQDLNKLHFNRKETTAKEQFRIILRSNTVWASTIMIRKDILKEIGWYNEKYPFFEDRPLLLAVLEAGYKIHYLDIFGAKYRRHSKSVQVRSNVFLSKFREDNQRFFVIEYLNYYTPKEQKKMKQIYKKSLFLKKMFNNKPYFLVKVLNRLF
jgi:alpha-1,3-rhamnosyltransferase